MRFPVVLLCALLLLFSIPVSAAESGWVSPPGVVEVTVSADAEAPAASAPRVTARRGTITVEVDGRRISLDRKQQRSMGLTRGQVRRTLREMRRDGFEGDKEEVAYELQDRLYDKNPDAWEAVAQQNGVMSTGSGENVAIDWDGLLQFLEALIPIIEKLLEIFSSFNFALVEPAPSWYVAAGCQLHLAA